MFYLAANIYNKYGKPIILKSSDNQPADQVIPVNGVAQLTKDVPNQTPVVFEAFDASAPKLKLSMNGRKSVSITPSTVKGAPHTVEIKDGKNVLIKMLFSVLTEQITSCILSCYHRFPCFTV